MTDRSEVWYDDVLNVLRSFGKLVEDGLEDRFPLVSRPHGGAYGVPPLEEKADQPVANETVRARYEDLVRGRDGRHGGVGDGLC